MTKVTKYQANYVDFAQSRKCKNCKHYREVKRPYTCSRVKGKINPEGSCTYWKYFVQQ